MFEVSERVSKEALLYLGAQVEKWKVMPCLLLCMSREGGTGLLHIFAADASIDRELLLKMLKDAVRLVEGGAVADVPPGSTELPKLPG